jgi:ADP-heptose:LPS heptosyltransferase
VNKYLIFRTDRIGDFLLSMILIKNIKRNDKKSYIIVVCSEKNYAYIKTINLVDEVIKLKPNFISRIKVIKKLRQYKFKFTIVHDGKKRSNFINFFLNKNKSFSVNNNDIRNSHFFKIKRIIHLMNFKFDSSDLDILINKDLNLTNLDKTNLIVLHYDEKWSNSTYISKYRNIEPSEDQFLNFIKNIRLKSNHELVITTGIITPLILKNTILKIKDDNVKLVEGLNFEELENIVSQSKLLISCHGAISHVASAYNIRQIDIIDINTQNPYSNWTDHFRNYYPIYRKNFTNLSTEILNLVI